MVPDSLWFEIAIVSGIFAIGNILLGHFEEKTPKPKRLAKFFGTLGTICCLSYYFGRPTAFVVLSLFLLPALYIHLIDLPKKGINGWTGEPKEKYYKLRGWEFPNKES